jgi:Flp pilus assembly protein TadG
MTPLQHLIARRPLRLAAIRSRAGLGDERGSSLVEFALTATLLFMLAIGIISMSLALYSYNVLSEAAREGARYAIVRGSACHFASACPATAANIQSYVQSLGFLGVNPANLTAATVWSVYPAGGTCTPSASCNNPGNQVKVTVSYSFVVAIPYVSRRTLSMSNTAAMVISQ